MASETDFGRSVNGMPDTDIVLVSDLEDIAEILNNNGYATLAATIPKVIAILRERAEKIRSLDRTIEDICCGGAG